MAMVGRPRDFRHHDVVRAIRAVRAAGVENPSVRIRTPAGVEYHFGGEVKGVPDPGPKVGDPVRDSASLRKGGKGSFGDLGVRAFPLAKGGSSHGMVKRQAADTAPPGRTAKTKRAAAPKEASGGIARPAKPA